MEPRCMAGTAGCPSFSGSFWSSRTQSGRFSVLQAFGGPVLDGDYIALTLRTVSNPCSGLPEGLPHRGAPRDGSAADSRAEKGLA